MSAGSRYVPPRAIHGKNSGSRRVWWLWRIPKRPRHRTRYIPYHCCRTTVRACLPAWRSVLLHRADCSLYAVRRWYRLGHVFRRPEQDTNLHSRTSSPLPTIFPSHRRKYVPIPVPSRKRDSPSRKTMLVVVVTQVFPAARGKECQSCKRKPHEGIS